MTSKAAQTAICIVKFYQKWISPALPDSCIYSPPALNMQLKHCINMALLKAYG